MNKDIIDAAIKIAFEAGRWQGQVDLEEFYDREQYASCCLEVFYAKRCSMPLHKPSTGNTVTINLRSNEWREGVRKTTEELLGKAKNYLLAIS